MIMAFINPYTILSFTLVTYVMGVKKRTNVLRVSQEAISGHESHSSKHLHSNIL
jgi:hypothetical protein